MSGVTDAVAEVGEVPAGAVSGFSLLPLKAYQETRVQAMIAAFQDTATKMEIAPARRREIALAQGSILLRAPTGSGKTLVMGRTLERLVGHLPRKVCWFWFTPYSGLVAQTREALGAQCPNLRMRDLTTERNPNTVRDGDVFAATWASVCARNREARLTRQEAETIPSVDLLVQALRADGWYIGAVVDEAHVNFGTSAVQAARFYLDVLQPDFTVLATATPKDEALETFERATGMQVSRIGIGRDEVVKACLNKIGIRAVHFRADPKDAAILDMEEVAVYAGLRRHQLIKQALQDAGVELTPLLMIQVENAARGEPDPVEKVKAFLRAQRIPADAVAVHTSGEPDPAFHTLAYDEHKEVLIFKVSAATGFDAPRAWTLVSLRKSVGREFGHQVLGRIMRVHRRVQHLHPFASNPPRTPERVLDTGYVFLANPGQQTGIAMAADELKLISDGIEMVTGNALVVEVGAGQAVLLDPRNGFAELLDQPQRRQPDQGRDAEPTAETGTRDMGLFDLDTAANDAEAKRANARAVALKAQQWVARELDLGGGEGGAPPRRRAPENWELTHPVDPDPASGLQGRVAYPLRTDIQFPRALRREVMPRTMEGLVQGIADSIRLDADALNLVNKTKGKVLVTEEDVFGHARTVGRENVPLSNLLIAQQAQLAFAFNEGIDPRDLKPALLKRLRERLEEEGLEIPDEKSLRRAVDLLAMARPDLLHDACRNCLARAVDVKQDEEIPPVYYGPEGLERASKGLYGVFPADLNIEETAFARLLDDDRTGTVQWWLRNVENARWAVSIVLPNGKRHYPDFVIGIDARRRSEDHIALVEVKDDGRTGRLFSTVNTDKVRSSHRDYKSALMVCRNDRSIWYKVIYRPELRMHNLTDVFTIDDLIWSQ